MHMHVKLVAFEGLPEIFVHLHFKDEPVPEFIRFRIYGLLSSWVVVGFKNKWTFILCPVCSCNLNFIWALSTM